MKEENYDYISRLEKDNWWYRGKRNFFCQILAKEGRIFESALDLGCGTGSNYPVLSRFSKKVVGVDNSSKAIFYCRNKRYSKLAKMDATSLKFKKNSFDLVLCSDVLEHVDDKKAIKQISKVLRPKGIMVFSVPSHKFLWGPTDTISNHKRRYEKRDLARLLSPYFSITSLKYWNFLMFIPNLLFTSIFRIAGSKKEYNSLNIIPNNLNQILYFLIRIENIINCKIGLFQGVSIIGICEKK